MSEVDLFTGMVEHGSSKKDEQKPSKKEGSDVGRASEQNELSVDVVEKESLDSDKSWSEILKDVPEQNRIDMEKMMEMAEDYYNNPELITVYPSLQWEYKQEVEPERLIDITDMLQSSDPDRLMKMFSNDQYPFAEDIPLSNRYAVMAVAFSNRVKHDEWLLREREGKWFGASNIHTKLSNAEGRIRKMRGLSLGFMWLAQKQAEEEGFKGQLEITHEQRPDVKWKNYLEKKRETEIQQILKDEAKKDFETVEDEGDVPEYRSDIVRMKLVLRFTDFGKNFSEWQKYGVMAEQHRAQADWMEENYSQSDLVKIRELRLMQQGYELMAEDLREKSGTLSQRPAGIPEGSAREEAAAYYRDMVDRYSDHKGKRKEKNAPRVEKVVPKKAALQFLNSEVDEGVQARVNEAISNGTEAELQMQAIVNGDLELARALLKLHPNKQERYGLMAMVLERAQRDNNAVGYENVIKGLREMETIEEEKKRVQIQEQLDSEARKEEHRKMQVEMAKDALDNPYQRFSYYKSGETEMEQIEGNVDPEEVIRLLNSKEYDDMPWSRKYEIIGDVFRQRADLDREIFEERKRANRVATEISNFVRDDLGNIQLIKEIAEGFRILQKQALEQEKSGLTQPEWEPELEYEGSWVNYWNSLSQEEKDRQKQLMREVKRDYIFQIARWEKEDRNAAVRLPLWKKFEERSVYYKSELPKAEAEINEPLPFFNRTWNMVDENEYYESIVEGRKERLRKCKEYPEGFKLLAWQIRDGQG